MNQDTYEEPELVDKMESHTDNRAENIKDFATKMATEEVKGIRNQILLMGGLWLFVAGVIFFAVLSFVVWLLALILPSLFTIFIVLFIIVGIVVTVNFIINLFKKK